MVYLAPVTGLATPFPATFPSSGVTVHAGFEAAACSWRRLEKEGLLTPYQHFDFIEAWWREIGQHQNVVPLIAIGGGPHNEPTFVWPLGQRRSGPFTIAEPLGGKHASYHFGPWSERMLAEGKPGLDAAIRHFAAAAPHIDAIALPRQLVEWRGRKNPFAAFNPLPAASNAHRTRLDPDPDAYMARVLSHAMRKQVRSKTRKFEALPGFRMERATRLEDVARLLDAFMQQKAMRFAEMGIPNPFALQGTRGFFDVLTEASASISLEVYGLEAEGEIAAVMGGIGDGRRFSAMFNSFAPHPHGKLTPGYVLTAHVIADLCGRGYETFDLGVGEARYKGHFCDEAETLVDVWVPLTASGRLYVAASRQAQRVKRAVKGSPLLWNTITRLRRVGVV